MKLTLHITPVMSHLRVYTEGKSYEAKDDFIFICTVAYIGEGEVWLSGAKGIFTREIYRLIKKHFLQLGIKLARYEKSKPRAFLARRAT